MKCRFFVLTVALLVPVGCLDEAIPDYTSTSILVESLHQGYLNSGNCLISVQHGTIVGSRMVFCARVQRRHCSAAYLSDTAAEIESLRSDIRELGGLHLACTVDAEALASFLDSLNAPNHPVIASYGATKDALIGASIGTVSIEACESVGLTLSSFGGGATTLMTEDQLDSMKDARLLLWRYAANNSCRNAIPLTSGERAFLTNMAAGAVRDMMLCDTGVDDPGLPDCPSAVAEYTGL